MINPHSHSRVPTEREPWSGRMLRQLTEVQSAHWRFRLFGPLTSPRARTVDRSEALPMRAAAAKQHFA